MKAIIIAAGSGTRLGGHAKKIPKSLLKINGKTLLEIQVSLLRKNGIDEIIVITGPSSKKFDLRNIQYIHDVNHLENDILFSLMAAKKKITGDVLISYSDIIYEEKILHQILEFEEELGIAVDLNWKKSYIGRSSHPLSEAENVLIKNNQILEVRKNIKKRNDQHLGEFLGIMKLSKNGAKIFVKQFNQLKKNHKGKFHGAESLKKAYLTDMIQELIDTGNKVKPILINGKWYEIDTEQDLKKVKRIF